MSKNKIIRHFFAVAAALTGALSCVDAMAVCFSKNPLDMMEVSSNWGVRIRPNAKLANGDPWKRPHNGFDLSTRKQQLPTYAVMDGIVTLSTSSDSQGNFVNINGVGEFQGLKTTQMHLSASIVKNGQKVAAGEKIGTTGDTGAGIHGVGHLHFEVRANNGQYTQDPRGYFCPVPKHQTACPAGVTSGACMQETYDLITLQAVPVNYSPSGNGAITTLPGGVPVGTTPTTTPTNPPANTDGTPSLVPPGVTTMAASGGIPPDAPFPIYTGRSKANFFAHEVSARFTNPTWIKELIDPLFILRQNPLNTIQAGAALGNPQLMLTREIAIMMAISNTMRLETRDIRVNTEAMMTAILAMQVQDYSKSVMDLVIKNIGKK
jgi:murein DD-endopeptidase MepM/ murein hydrolase activator NlpD